MFCWETLCPAIHVDATRHPPEQAKYIPSWHRHSPLAAEPPAWQCAVRHRRNCSGTVNATWYELKASFRPPNSRGTRNKPDPQRPYIAICKIQRILCQCPGARPQRIPQRSFINASTGLIYMMVEPHGSDFSGASHECSIRLRSEQFGDEYV